MKDDIGIEAREIHGLANTKETGKDIEDEHGTFS
jgi:hypothetical protein